MVEIIEIDGSQGEGGGQILRTSLSLSACLGVPVRLYNIRAGRRRAGLLRQHLACVNAVQAICQADVRGAHMGSTEVCFRPGEIEGGTFDFSIGSAGSTTLLFQAVIMPLLKASGVSKVTFEGGTHNGMAPSYDFIEHAFLPVLAQIGGSVESHLEAFGFYPAGGGRWAAQITPVTEWHPLTLMDRGGLQACNAVATSANIATKVNARELAYVEKRCGWPSQALQSLSVASAGPGNILSLRVVSESVTEVIDSVGEKRVSSERVAARAVQRLNRYMETCVPVGEHLADQLIVPLLLGAGGQFRTLEPSTHLMTNVNLVNQFVPGSVACKQLGADDWQVAVSAID